MPIPSYGSVPTKEAMPEPVTSLGTEFKLALTSPGLWFVIFYAGVCNWFNDAVSVNIRPFSGEFLKDGEFVKNPELDYPVLPFETFPYLLMIKLCYGIPFVACFTCWLLYPIAGDMRAAVIAFVGSMATTDLATDLAKNYVGRLRPFFYEKCEFDTEDATCRLPHAQQDLLRQSFPSGHASLGTCAMLFTTLYLLGKVGSPASLGKLVVPLPWGLQPLRLAPAAALVATLPMWLSGWMMCSRVHDNWHHPADVATGAVLGGVIAMLWYSLGYPPIFGPDSHLPLVSPVREEKKENVASSPAAEVPKEKHGLVV